MKQNLIIILTLILILVVITGIIYMSKSAFNRVLNGPVNLKAVKSFPKINQQHGNFPPLEKPTVKEETGLAMVFPTGAGASMSNLDSNAFTPGKPGPLLTNYTIPESYGESSLTDPSGNKGANQGARIIQMESAGNQLIFKPTDESENAVFSAAYHKGEVQTGNTHIDSKFINYSSSFKPEHNLTLQTSPGQESTLKNCESTFPRVEKYKDFCITEGDIPYGQIVNGKVNPRLVSRWESYTGDYSRKAALEPIDGLLYPTLNI